MKKLIKESPVDNRDYSYNKDIDSVILPTSYLATKTKVRCQWLSSQCVAYACTQAMSQQEAKKGKYNLYSPGLLYANREEDDYQGEGWWVRKALKQLHTYGTCLEKDFPIPESYKTERKKFLENKEELLAKAAEHKIKSYFRCNSVEEVKSCIFEYGCVIVETQISIKGFWKYNLKKEDAPEKGGGHAFILVGWDEEGWIAQDSYSIFRPWLGQFHIEYDYPINEFWGIEL